MFFFKRNTYKRIPYTMKKDNNQRLVVILGPNITTLNTIDTIEDFLIFIDEKYKNKAIEINNKYHDFYYKFSYWDLKQLINYYSNYDIRTLNEKGYDYMEGNTIVGLKELIGFFKDRGFVVGIVSKGFDFIYNSLKKIYNIDFIVGSRIELDSNITTNQVKYYCDYKNKWETIKQECDYFKIKYENTLIIGGYEPCNLSLIQEAGFYIRMNCLQKENYLSILKRINNNKMFNECILKNKFNLFIKNIKYNFWKLQIGNYK